MAVKAAYLLAVGGGAIVLWSGFKGKQWSTVLRNVIGGVNPNIAATAYEITPGSPGSNGGTGGSNGGFSAGGGGATGIVASALADVGTGYTWDGSPAKGPGQKDCSSAVNKWVGWENGYAIPGFKAGTYKGQVHGPNTLIWIVSPLCKTVSRKNARPGDLAVWQTHMGIITDNGQHMISALNERIGTKETTIDGIVPGEVLVVRRLKALG